MVTVTDRKVMNSLIQAARGTERCITESAERTEGYLVGLYDLFYAEFGNQPFPAGKLNKKFKERLIRGCLDVGETPANRNLSDREVVGSRLTSLGYVELLPHPDYMVRLTEAGSARAEEIIASL